MQHELVHEVWLDRETDHQMLPGLCLDGPKGGWHGKFLQVQRCHPGDPRSRAASRPVSMAETT